MKLKLSLAFIIGFISAHFLFHPAQTDYPQPFPLLKRSGYTACYDNRNKIPLWTYEKLTPLSLNKAAHRQNYTFQDDPDTHILFQSHTTDYTHSGFDRGHMIPARDQSHSENHLRETFLLTNICPQEPTLNRGLWKNLEEYARSLIPAHQTVHVYTGPLFLPSSRSDGSRFITYDLIGASDVAVPTHFFKLIITDTTQEAYLVPNKQLPPKSKLQDFIVSVDTVQKYSGLLFPFP